MNSDSAPLDTASAPLAAPGRRFGAAESLLSLRVLVVLCVLLPLVAYVAVGTYRYQQIRMEAEVRIDRSLRIASEHALRVLDTNETLISRIEDVLGSDDSTALQARAPQLHEFLKRLAADKPQVQSLWVWGPDGRQVAGDRQLVPRPGLSVSERAYFQWHRAKLGGTYVSEPLIGRSTGEMFFDMSRGRYKADGSFDGVVSVSLYPSYFGRFHGDLVADEPGLAITMFRSDGTVYSRAPAIADAPARLGPDSPTMAGIRAGRDSGTARGRSTLDGQDRLLNYTRLGSYPIYLGTGMAASQIWRRWFVEMAWLAGFGLPPMLGLYLAARLALRRTRTSLETAERLNTEMQARRRVEEALLQAQKLEALGRLTGGVAHDFNNALMVISTNLYLLRRKPEGSARYLDSVEKAVGSATKLTRQLLAFSRRQALVPEHSDLRQILPALQDLLAPVLGSQIELVLEVAPDTQGILVDPAEFELALLNLAINARDAMPRGGRFHLRARNARSLPPLLKGPMVVVEASDTGVGIAPELLQRVFEPFFTTKEVGHGTGLGLSQIYGLCQRAGGLATIDSQVGQGTTVRLYFPAVSQAAPAQPPGRPAGDRKLGLHVLLVEDNDEVAAALQQVLQALDCTVTRFDRAVAAYDWLLTAERLPELLLSDVVMPGEYDGAELARRVRRAFPGLRIVLMTGYAQQIDAITGMGFEVLPKPCSAELLMDTIRPRAADAPAARQAPA